MKKHGSSVMRQIVQVVQRYSDHFGKNEKRGIPLKVFFFFEKFPLRRTVPFVVPPEQSVFPFKRKALKEWLVG